MTLSQPTFPPKIDPVLSFHPTQVHSAVLEILQDWYYQKSLGKNRMFKVICETGLKKHICFLLEQKSDILFHVIEALKDGTMITSTCKVKDGHLDFAHDLFLEKQYDDSVTSVPGKEYLVKNPVRFTLFSSEIVPSKKGKTVYLYGNWNHGSFAGRVGIFELTNENAHLLIKDLLKK